MNWLTHDVGDPLIGTPVSTTPRIRIVSRSVPAGQLPARGSCPGCGKGAVSRATTASIPAWRRDGFWRRRMNGSSTRSFRPRGSSLELGEVLGAVVRLLSDASAVHACFVYLIENGHPCSGRVGAVRKPA